NAQLIDLIDSNKSKKRKEILVNQEYGMLDYDIQEKLKSQQYKTNVQPRKRSVSPIEKKREIKKTCKKEEDIVQVFDIPEVHNTESRPVKSTNKNPTVSPPAKEEDLGIVHLNRKEK
ncbi:11851_t:CDS:2, partial [Dentiscutata heterogama]